MSSRVKHLTKVNGAKRLAADTLRLPEKSRLRLNVIYNQAQGAAAAAKAAMAYAETLNNQYGQQLAAIFEAWGVDPDTAQPSINLDTGVVTLAKTTKPDAEEPSTALPVVAE